MVAEAADVPLDDAVGMLEGATTAGLLLEGDEVAHYRFTHVLLRDAVYDDLVGLRRAQLHGRVADALAGRDDGSLDIVTEMARHLARAAPVIGPDRGIEAALRASEAARSALAYEQAEAHLRQALDLVGTVRGEIDRDRYELQIQLRLGFLLYHTRTAARPEVTRAFDRAQALCARAGVTVDHLRMLWGQYFMAYMGGCMADTAVIAQQLLELGRTGDDRRFVLAGRVALGTSEFYLGRLAPAREQLAGAVAVVDAMDDPSLQAVFNQDPRVTARNLLALATFLLGDADEADGIVAEQLRLLATIDHRPTQLMGRLSHGWYWLLRGDPERVLDVSGQAIERAETLGYLPILAAARMHHGWALARLGSTGAGTAMLRRSLEAMDRAGVVAARPCFLGLLAEAELLDGRTEAALATIDAALAEVPRRNDRFYLPELYRLRGEILGHAGPDRRDEAAACFGQAWREADTQGAVVFRDRLPLVSAPTSPR